MKRGLCFLFAILLLSSSVAAQTADIDQIGEEVEKIRELTEEERLTFLANQWKEILLENRVVSAFDGFFNDVNMVFVILFGRGYDLSLELLLAILVWFFTWGSLEKYMRGVSFLKEGWHYVIASLVLTVLLAQLQLFNLIAGGLIKVLFLRASFAWTAITGVVIFIALIIYYKLNVTIAAGLKGAKQAGERKSLEGRVEKQEEFTKAVKKGYKG